MEEGKCIKHGKEARRQKVRKKYLEDGGKMRHKVLDMWVCTSSNFWMEPCEVLKSSWGKIESSRIPRAGGLRISEPVKRKKPILRGKTVHED